MPSLKFCGVHWAWASDDFACPAVCLALLRTVWVLVLGMSLGDLDQPALSGCRATGSWARWWDDGRQCNIGLLWLLIGSLLALQLANWAIEMASAVVALRGSVMDTGQRRCIDPLLYLHCLTSAIELGLTVLGMQVAYKPPDDLQLGVRCAACLAPELLLGFPNQTQQQLGGHAWGRGSVGGIAETAAWAWDPVSEEWMGPDELDVVRGCQYKMQAVCVTLCVLLFCILCSVYCTHRRCARSSEGCVRRLTES
jgi:hypothetical protein